MSRTALIYRVDQLPSVFVPRSLYITKVNGESHYDLFLSTSDGLNIERIITDSDVVPMFNAQSNKANGVLQLDSNGMVPVDRVPNIPADKILSSLTVDTSGNSASATKLKTARSINGVAFDGTANITINAVDSTARIASSEKGVANGVATLGDDGKVPSSQLPSFVDDILEFTNLASFPATGESGKIYLALDSNKIYRWSGSTYIDVNSSVSSADTAVKLATARTISVTGDASLSFSFDGSQDISSSLTLANSGVTAGEYPVTTVNAKGLVVGGRTLTQADIPPLSGSKIINTLLVDTLGNAGTATRLQTARLINGVAFDGTQDIVVGDTVPRIAVSEKAAPNGVATLDASGLVPLSQLPSFVDDVVEYANLAGFPVSGDSGKIYVALDTNKTYRWSGSTYVYITSGAVDSVNGRTGVVTLSKSDIGLGNVDNTADMDKPVSTAQAAAIQAAVTAAVGDQLSNIVHPFLLMGASNA